MRCEEWNSGAFTTLKAGRIATVEFPDGGLGPLLGNSACARRVSAQTPGLLLLRQYLNAACAADALGTPAVRALAVAHIHDLAALALGASREAEEIANGRGVSAARFAAIKRDILARLDREVKLGDIAGRHQVSPRYIRMLFESDGTSFTEFVRSERLNRRGGCSSAAASTTTGSATSLTTSASTTSPTSTGRSGDGLDYRPARPASSVWQARERHRVALPPSRHNARLRAQRSPLLVGQLPHRARGRTDDQTATREFLAFGHQRAGADQAFALEHRAVEYPRAHPDQAIVADRAAVEDRLVADGHPSADGQREAGVAMADRAVLDVAFLADHDWRVVGADHGTEPHLALRPAGRRRSGRPRAPPTLRRQAAE